MGSPKGRLALLRSVAIAWYLNGCSTGTICASKRPSPFMSRLSTRPSPVVSQPKATCPRHRRHRRAAVRRAPRGGGGISAGVKAFTWSGEREQLLGNVWTATGLR